MIHAGSKSRNRIALEASHATESHWRQVTQQNRTGGIAYATAIEFHWRNHAHHTQ